MANHHTPTVTSPEIPAADLTPLERLILGLALDEIEGPDGLCFHSWEGASDTVSTEPDDLRTAWTASQDRDSRINAVVAALLARYDAADPDDRLSYIDIHLTDGPVGLAEILQDIVRRSPSMREITLIMSFMSTTIRTDGFGGSVTRITADAIQHYSTDTPLAQMCKDIPT
ncbi:hypothetical protein [Rhizobium leguminosarum]|uniref:hypothetical protein n=1 Tax=Rhizobium leguminosarum TaxID=384 RepID=UPI001C95E32F|nr:hypothetical protein [Rhizobium leguminosarum]MBY5827401.1 hypothetical protein [Rhizobium leguminosarum]